MCHRRVGTLEKHWELALERAAVLTGGGPEASFLASLSPFSWSLGPPCSTSHCAASSLKTRRDVAFFWKGSCLPLL